MEGSRIEMRRVNKIHVFSFIHHRLSAYAFMQGNSSAPRPFIFYLADDKNWKTIIYAM